MKVTTMKTHRTLMAVLALFVAAPTLGACELVVDFDRTKIADDAGADMAMALDMNMPTDMPTVDMPPTDMPPTDMPPTDMPMADMNVPDMPMTDMNVPDMPGADLGPADLGMDMGMADLGRMCPASCDDSNPCTDDSCVVATGLCAHVNNTDPCNDANACTMGDVCTAGVCVAGTPRDCSGMDTTCRLGTCNTAGICVPGAARNEGMTCDDANDCTMADLCTAGVCDGTDIADGMPCGVAMMCMTGACI
jgi:hypothetical protein